MLQQIQLGSSGQINICYNTPDFILYSYKMYTQTFDVRYIFVSSHNGSRIQHESMFDPVSVFSYFQNLFFLRLSKLKAVSPG